MGLGMIALIVFVAVTIVWFAALRRDIAEALLVAFLATAVCGGWQAPQLVLDGVVAAATSEVLFAAMAFVVMSQVTTTTGLVGRLAEILNSLFGRLPGGAGYVSTLASALFGLVSGSGAGNAATVGTITVPWMKQSNWRPRESALIVTGNAGLGIALPPSSTMFILLAAPGVSGVTIDQVLVPLLAAGCVTLVYRLAVVAFLARRYRVRALSGDLVPPLRQTLRAGWTSGIIFLGVAVPLLLTVGPVANALRAVDSVGDDGVDAISIIIWVPVLITVFALVEGRRRLPRGWSGLHRMVLDGRQSLAAVGGSVFFALAASDVLARLGLDRDLSSMLSGLDLPKSVLVLVVCSLLVLVASPLSSTSTVATIGGVAFVALTGAGLPPVLAFVIILIATSTEGASPPGAAALFIAAGLAKVDPSRIFLPAVVYYVAPIIVIAWLLGMGFIPIPL
ncbi:MAG: TRAP transporter large permease subunit [Streptosporangiales bacterium]|nr:TRAP transporter large permease subunit [Streptosporangiales bacterium]